MDPDVIKWLAYGLIAVSAVFMVVVLSGVAPEPVYVFMEDIEFLAWLVPERAPR